MINAATHQARADLRRGDLQLRARAEFVTANWEVGNIFRELLNRGEAKLRPLTERHFARCGKERARRGAAGATAISTPTDHLFADRCAYVLAKLHGDAREERLTLCWGFNADDDWCRDRAARQADLRPAVPAGADQRRHAITLGSSEWRVARERRNGEASGARFGAKVHTNATCRDADQCGGACWEVARGKFADHYWRREEG